MGRGRTVTALSSFSQASQTTWASLPHELLRDIITRVESGHSEWPSRRSVVACACVCRAWRDLTRDVTRTSNPEPSGRLTFPEDLRHPGPRDRCVECFIKRNRKTGTFTLFLGLQPTPTETGKFLMAARKCGWRPSSMEYVVSLDPRDFSRSGSGYLGRLRANFLSTRFTIFDSSTAMASAQHQHQQQQQASSATATQCSSGSSKVHPGGLAPSPSKSSSSSGQVGGSAAGSSSSAPPPLPAVSVAYALNVLGTRGPRRIQCVLHNVPSCPNTPTPAAAAGAGVGPKTGGVPNAMSSLATKTGSLAGSSRMSAGGSSASLRLSEDAADTASSASGSSLRDSTGLLPVAPAAGRESSYEDVGSSVPGGSEEVDGARARGSSGSLDGASGGAVSGLVAAVADCSVSHTGEECDCRECLGSGPLEPMVLKNKPPRWHDQLQCWCLNFRGRVTVASVKNFQLVDGGAPGSDSDKPVLLQFGKIGKDTFTMDYQFPLSAFQAFAICLSSFDTKVACE